MINIIIADDHNIVIEGLTSLLVSEDDIKICGLAHNGNEVLDLLDKQEIDIVVSDINMPEMDGVELTRKIKSKFPSIKVLILTMYNDINFIRRIAEVGAEGYVLKNMGKEELTNAIKILYDGGQYFGEEVIKTLFSGMRQPNMFGEIKLTKREKEVLRLVANGYTTPKISYELNIAHSTVETHRRNLIEKTGVKNSKGLVKYAFENGYS